MKYQSVFKVTILVALGVVTSLATTTLMNKMKRAEGGTSIQADRRKTSIGENQATALAQIKPGIAAISHPDVLATYGMNAKVDVKGQVVHVVAKAEIQDKRAGMSFVWAVRFHPEGDESKVLHQKVYSDQIFTPGQERVEPTFVDDIEVPLEPGNYLMTIAAYQVTPEKGLQGLQFENAERGPWFTGGIKLGP